MIPWKELEENTKTISQYKWNSQARPESVAGINFDCVLKPDSDNWIIIEATVNNKLEKVRTDIAKHASARASLFTQNIYAKHYIVLSEEPTLSMITTAKAAHIKIMSFSGFSNEFLDFKSYSHSRSKKIFGSSVNPFSGKSDDITYTPVHYEILSTKKEISLKDISKKLINKENIILLGNYGTGKSRCVRELFSSISKSNLNNNKLIYPIALST